jgi:hypothetical protein
MFYKMQFDEIYRSGAGWSGMGRNGTRTRMATALDGVGLGMQ